MTQPQLTTGSSPHLRGDVRTPGAMKDVLLALVPVMLVALYLFQGYAVLMIATGMAVAAATEVVFRALRGKPSTLHDYSAVLTGAFVGLLSSPGGSPLSVVVATVIGVGIGKELVGGLGWNRLNPAALGLVSIWFLAPFFPVLNATFMPWEMDAVTQATPLALLQRGMELPGLGELFVAFPGGTMAETSPLAVLIGGAYLIYRQHVDWRIPASILGAVVVLVALAGQNPVEHLLTGALVFGAFFMATDWATSPVTPRGRVVYGICLGALVVLFRVALPPTEGVIFAILIMNALVPTLERITMRPSFAEPSAARKG